ncbi:CapA family protein [Mycobacterium sp. IS-3022]|uniref:CapA family protein n=1 Tax=Mycobacterium sp. IS-3022 TaxID=1772277 RepID=UPI000B26FF75|nr:CapA family protein [Mycobacterium sp. IS-3022]
MARATGSDAVVFLTGDVMTGRGIDQILPHPGDPRLRESVVSDARTYVRLAERINGPVPAPVDVSWPWGDALSILDEMTPDVRVINLETSVTTSSEFAPRKAVHYRMHPHNIGCLSAVRPDVCVLANNHTLDFGHAGLAETLRVVGGETRCAGAGSDIEEASRPAVVEMSGGTRAVVSAIGFPSSGIPSGWAATDSRPGVALVSDLSDCAAAAVAGRTLAEKRPGDITVVSMHWGSNWGYEVDEAQIRFAHRLVDEGVDVVHGHSSHHPRPIEVYRGKLILYGCGDTIDDYEGIATYEAFRHDLRLLYFASIDRHSGRLTQLTLVPMRMRRMRLERAADSDAEWLRASVEQMSARFATRVRWESDGALTVVW